MYQAPESGQGLVNMNIKYIMYNVQDYNVLKPTV